jgi:hypothetical protein
MPNIPSQTMLPVIAKIVAGQAQQPRCGTARIFSKHAPLIMPLMIIVLREGLILTRPSCPAYRPSSSPRDASEHGLVSVVAAPAQATAL